MKALFLLALTLAATVSIVVGAAIAPKITTPTSPITRDTARATNSADVQLLGETIDDPTAGG